MKCPEEATSYQRYMWAQMEHEFLDVREGCTDRAYRIMFAEVLEEEYGPGKRHERTIPAYKAKCWHADHIRQPEFDAVRHLPFTSKEVMQVFRDTDTVDSLILGNRCYPDKWIQMQRGLKKREEKAANKENANPEEEEEEEKADKKKTVRRLGWLAEEIAKELPLYHDPWEWTRKVYRADVSEKTLKTVLKKAGLKDFPLARNAMHEAEWARKERKKVLDREAEAEQVAIDILYEHVLWKIPGYLTEAQTAALAKQNSSS